MEPLKELLKTLPTPLDAGYKPRTQEEDAQYRADLDNRTPGDLDDGVDCPKCLNRGFISVVIYDEQFKHHVITSRACVCQKLRAANRRLRRSGLEEVVKTKTFDSYETPEAWHQTVKQRAMNFCEDTSGKWFFIGGQSGAGKSHLCTAISGELMQQGKELRYMLWRDEIARINAVVNDPEQYGPLMDGLKRAEVLYIDDLFKGGKDERGNYKPPTAADINRAFEIINHRYNNPGLITIISSERTLTELNEIDEAIAGRIAERSKEGGFCISLKKNPARNWRMRGLGEV